MDIGRYSNKLYWSYIVKGSMLLVKDFADFKSNSAKSKVFFPQKMSNIKVNDMYTLVDS